MRIVVNKANKAIKEATEREIYKKKILAAQKIIKQLSLPLAGWLVRLMEQPEKRKETWKAISKVFKMASLYVPYLSENDDRGANKAFIDYLKQALIDSGHEDEAKELQAMLDDQGLSLDKVEIIAGDSNKADSVIREKEKEKKETDRARKKRIFGRGYDEMRKISLGIMEEDEPLIDSDEEPEDKKEEKEVKHLLYSPSGIEEIKKEFRKYL